MVNMRQEVDHIRKEHVRFQRRAGDQVVWFEQIPFGLDPNIDSTLDSLYDEAPVGTGGRRYRSGIVIPVFWVIENEDDRRAIPDGRLTQQTLRFSVGYSQLIQRQITEPWESTRHTGDMVYWDGRYYHIHTYKVMGRLQDDIGVSVAATEEYLNMDYVNDPGPGLPGVVDIPWPATLPQDH